MIKVSVIIPVYKASNTIERCARSLFSQTLKDIEYLFIDDCTPDDSIDIIRKVLAEYPTRIQFTSIHRMDKNSGQARVREWGMMHATGDYIIHCDSDDWVDKKMYETMYLKAKQSDSDVVFCDYNKVMPSETYKIERDKKIDTPSKIISKMLAGYDGYNQLWANLVKKECIKNIQYPKGNLGEDWNIMIQILLESKKISFLADAYYYYAYNPTSITNNISPDATLRCVDFLESNITQICKILDARGVLHNYTEEMVMTKFKPRNILWTLLYDKRCRTRWYTIFPEIESYVLSNRYIPLKMKIKHALMRLHLGSIIGLYQKF